MREKKKEGSQREREREGECAAGYSGEARGAHVDAVGGIARAEALHQDRLVEATQRRKVVVHRERRKVSAGTIKDLGKF